MGLPRTDCLGRRKEEGLGSKRRSGIIEDLPGVEGNGPGAHCNSLCGSTMALCGDPKAGRPNMHAGRETLKQAMLSAAGALPFYERRRGHPPFSKSGLVR